MVDLSAIKSRLSWSIFLKLATAILAFAFTAVISRFLSLTDAGSFFYFMSGLILLSTIALAGQDIFAMRLTARLTAANLFRTNASSSRYTQTGFHFFLCCILNINLLFKLSRSEALGGRTKAYCLSCRWGAIVFCDRY